MKLACKKHPDEPRWWAQFGGEVESYASDLVRGEERLEIFVEAVRQRVVIDPKYMEDYTNVELDVLKPEIAQELIKGIPQDCNSIGLDIKAYLIPDDYMNRLAAWSGRRIQDGKKLNDSQLRDIGKNLKEMIRDHAGGYVKGALLPDWPAEDSLGLDRQLKVKRDASPTRTRRRSRSRSHSLARAMREEEEGGKPTTPAREPPEDSEVEETSAENLIEAYDNALQAGQAPEEALDTLRILFEMETEQLVGKLRMFAKKDAHSSMGRKALGILQCIVGPAKASTRLGPEPLDKGIKSENGSTSLAGKPLQDNAAEPMLIKPAVNANKKSNPLLDNDGIIGQLFGHAGVLGGDADGSRAGGHGDGEESEVISARVVHALEGIRKATEGDKKGALGSRSAIGSEESLDMYLARGCNTLTVEVCPDVTGKDLFDALKRACGHAKAKLQQIEWPCLVTNGIAYGLASMQHGGKDHTTLPAWTLSVAQAVTAKPRDFDNYEMPKDDKIENKPKHPTHFATWLKQARNEINMLGSVMGLEHKAERLQALEQIEKAHEKDNDVWPESYCYSLWEELEAAWVEELREARRRLCRVLNTDNPRKEDLKFVALAPGSGFRFPKTFDLGHPEGYFQQVCVPRQARALKGIIYGQLHHKRQAPKVGEVGGGDLHQGGGDGANEDDKLGKQKERNAKKKKDEKKAYPAGKRLRPKEAAESVKHAPKTREGKPICWDSASHMGCSRGKDCAHAHSPITTTKGLHWTVLAQLIRRGGIRSGPVIQPSQVDGRVAQLRTQAKSEHDEKIQEGSGQKQGWLPPSEYADVQ